MKTEIIEKPFTVAEAKSLPIYEDDSIDSLLVKINSHFRTGCKKLSFVVPSNHLVDVASMYENVGWMVTFVPNGKNNYVVTFSY